MSSIRQNVVDKGCDICQCKYTDKVYDARTVYGYWAFMCEDCYDELGKGLGVGKGQVYDVKTLKKIEG